MIVAKMWLLPRSLDRALRLGALCQEKISPGFRGPWQETVLHLSQKVKQRLLGVLVCWRLCLKRQEDVSSPFVAAAELICTQWR